MHVLNHEVPMICSGKEKCHLRATKEPTKELHV